MPDKLIGLGDFITAKAVTDQRTDIQATRLQQTQEHANIRIAGPAAVVSETPLSRRDGGRPVISNFDIRAIELKGFGIDIAADQVSTFPAMSMCSVPALILL